MTHAAAQWRRSARRSGGDCVPGEPADPIGFEVERSGVEPFGVWRHQDFESQRREGRFWEAVREITLTAQQYLDLKSAVEKVEKAEAAAKAQREQPLAELATQRLTVVVDGETARLKEELEVVVRGEPTKPVPLPIPGVTERLEVTPAGAAASVDGEVPVLVAPSPGTYKVKAASRALMTHRNGVQYVDLGSIAAPVAVIDLDVPSDANWSCPGGVLVAESVNGLRRHVRFSARQGLHASLELRRGVQSDRPTELSAETSVMTLFQVGSDGVRRYDVVLYSVSRGALESFEIAVPHGLRPDLVATDEGPATPTVEGDRLVVRRERPLERNGYLLLATTLPPLMEAS
jgi:hypothetical protein